MAEFFNENTGLQAIATEGAHRLATRLTPRVRHERFGHRTG